jgi:hypothetical protein
MLSFDAIIYCYQFFPFFFFLKHFTLKNDNNQALKNDNIYSMKNDNIQVFKNDNIYTMKNDNIPCTWKW